VPRISEAARAESRARILDAARELFATNGFHATSMDDILRAANMSAGGAYRYFASKDEIIAAIAEETVGSLAHAVRTVMDEEPDLRLDEALARIVRFIDTLAEKVGGLPLVVWAEAQRDPQIALLVKSGATQVRASVAELVRRTQTSAGMPADIDSRAVDIVVMSLLVGYLMQRQVVGDVDPESYAIGLAVLLGPTERA
jgi:AcrR family transcriptional regulator